MKAYDALKYIQGSQECYITVMPFGVINNVSKALIYDDINPYGYQRAINKIHTQKIYKSIKENESISPTSIVLGINRSDIQDYLENKEGDHYYLKIDKEKQKFRIIDGQHRLKGLDKAAQEDPSLLEYKLSVIVMIIEDKHRKAEVKLFNDINSKAKPLKMDLTILAMYNYEIIEEAQNININQHVAVKVAKILNDGDNVSQLWMNAIKIDVNNPFSTGIIGFKTFYESIEPICGALVRQEKTPVSDMPFKEVLSLVKCNATAITENLLAPCWNIVYNKWRECFKHNIQVVQDDKIETYFNKDYYLQRTMGAKTINQIIFEYLKENSNDLQKTITFFAGRIEASKLKYEDWEVGGRFSGLSSESGLKKIKELI